MKLYKIVLSAFCISAAVLPLYSCGETSAAGASVCSAYLTGEQTLCNYVIASGIVEGSDVISITSDLSAKVTKLYVNVGSSVKAGDILCEFDRTALQQEYDALQKEMENAEKERQALHQTHERALTLAENKKVTALNIAQRAIEEAEIQRDYAYERYNNMAVQIRDYESDRQSLEEQIAADPENTALQSAWQSLMSRLQSLQSDYAALEEKLISYDHAVANAGDKYRAAELDADAEIERAKDALRAESFEDDSAAESKCSKLLEKLAACTVTAPKDGLITSLAVKEGSIPSTDSIMTIADENALIINATVYESDILKIFEGQDCEITTTANSEKTYAGKILSVVKIRSEQSGESAVYSVRIGISDLDDSIFIGMSTQINIITEKLENTLAVPYDALGTENGRHFVYVAEGSEEAGYTVKKVYVESGMESGYLTAVSGDLSAGDQVLFPIKGLSENEPVHIKDVFSSDDYGN